jgi:hypothetical protein
MSLAVARPAPRNDKNSTRARQKTSFHHLLGASKLSGVAAPIASM